MSIELPKLSFSLDALEPHISKRTLEFHYGKHHQGYVTKVNELIKDTPLENCGLEEIMTATYHKHPKIYNNAAQVWNHNFMWKCLTSAGGEPSEKLQKAISRKFGSVDEFKNKFTIAARDLFGSGWAWLVKDKKGELQLRSLRNAENPLQLGDEPLLTCDVWEHAYYLDYQHERPKYLEHFWSLINWEFIEANLEAVGIQKTAKVQVAIRNMKNTEARQSFE